MNYFDYIENINPSDELETKVKNAVMSDVNERSRLRIRRRSMLISSAACFAVLAVCVASFNALNRSKPSVDGNTQNCFSE